MGCGWAGIGSAAPPAAGAAVVKKSGPLRIQSQTGRRKGVGQEARGWHRQRTGSTVHSRLGWNESKRAPPQGKCRVARNKWQAWGELQALGKLHCEKKMGGPLPVQAVPTIQGGGGGARRACNGTAWRPTAGSAHGCAEARGRASEDGLGGSWPPTVSSSGSGAELACASETLLLGAEGVAGAPPGPSPPALPSAGCLGVSSAATPPPLA